MRSILICLLFALLGMTAPASAQQTDDVALGDASATIALGDEYQFYGSADARRIVVEEWDNPANEAEGVLGLLMPASTSPGERAWGALVSWEPIGWVSNEDARGADYEALMAQMQADALRANDERRTQGFPEVSVIGWAQPPRYDSVRHAVTWGRELAFADGGPRSLHYDLRLLGRHGVLSVNIVGEMAQLPEIREAADDLSSRVAFDPGARYADYEEGQDDVASYGIAGLVATGVGVALAKNAGLLGILAKFAQPLGIALLILAAALATPLRRFFWRREPATR